MLALHLVKCHKINWLSELGKIFSRHFRVREQGISATAEVAKLVYALDLGSSAARRESSSLSFRTIFSTGAHVVVRIKGTGAVPAPIVLRGNTMQVSIETTSGLERRLTVGVPASGRSGSGRRLQKAAKDVRYRVSARARCP